MGVEIGKIRFGTIVWATVRDFRGYRKRRPAIVITPDAEISKTEPTALMAVTTTYPAPAPKDHVELPWNPDPRRVGTGLARRSAAVVTWLDTIYLDEIDGIIGTVPARVMGEIMARVSKYLDRGA